MARTFIMKSLPIQGGRGSGSTVFDPKAQTRTELTEVRRAEADSKAAPLKKPDLDSQGRIAASGLSRRRLPLRGDANVVLREGASGNAASTSDRSLHPPRKFAGDVLDDVGHQRLKFRCRFGDAADVLHVAHHLPALLFGSIHPGGGKLSISFVPL